MSSSSWAKVTFSLLDRDSIDIDFLLHFKEVCETFYSPFQASTKGFFRNDS